MLRIVFVTNYIPDYRFPVFQRLANVDSLQIQILTSSPLEFSCKAARETLRISYSRTMNVDTTTHHGHVGALQKEQMPVPLSLFADLLSIRPDVIVSGDFGLRSLVCWMTARLLRARFVLWSEEILSSAQGRSWLQLRMRKFFARRADACLGWGQPASDYLLSLGIKPEKLFRCAQAIDNEQWTSRADHIDREEVRRELGFSGKVFLLVGRLVERKGIKNFLEAWSHAKFSDQVTAVIVGTGDQEQELKEYAKSKRLRNVIFAGKQTGYDLARYYSACDVFVFPSLEDVWGLVVNEALSFGLPVLASKYAGATQQLIAGADAGTVFDPIDIESFASHLTQLAYTTPEMDRQKCRALLKNVSFDVSQHAIMDMLRHCQASGFAKDTPEDTPLIIGRVAIVQQMVPHYRVAFFRRLHERLAAKNIDMTLFYGTAARGAADTAEVITDQWAVNVCTRKTRIAGIDIIWQSVLPKLKGFDVVIVEQSNRLLINFMLLLGRPFSRRKLAYWGHGRNMQSRRPNGLRELTKRILLKRVDWWFAYTGMTSNYLISRKYPASQVTVVNNAVENKLHVQIRSLSNRSRKEVANALGLSGDNVALYCGGLYQQKRINFLLDAAVRVREKVPDFELLIVGEGPDRALVEQAAKQHDWIHYAGRVVGEGVAVYWYVSRILMMPGLVGLAIVDSFNAACPIVTTTYPYHSPEIAYLQPDVNGIQTDDDVHSFAQAVTEIIKDDRKLQVLRQGCVDSAARYTLDNMVNNFANGIEQCLKGYSR